MRNWELPFFHFRLFMLLIYTFWMFSLVNVNVFTKLTNKISSVA